MRLLLAASEFPPGPGGIATQAYELARGLGVLGWQVGVMARQAYAEASEVESFRQEQPFPVWPLPGGGFAPFAAAAGEREAGRRIRQWRPRVLVATGDRMVYLTAWVARIWALPWVAIEHGRVPGGWERRLKRWALGQATAVAAVSRYTWQRMLELGVEPRQGRVIPNGADAGRFRVLPPEELAEVRRSLGFDGARLLITVGNVSHRKGQDVVIRALPRVLRRGPNAHYLVVGIPTEQERCQALARELGVDGQVHFLGRVEANRLVRLLNISDIFVMTSRHADHQFEGYGIAAVEAALCGLPAVVTAGSGLSEAVAAGETAMEAPEDDPGAVAEAILRLLEDETLRRRMGEAARQRALADQTWDRRIREYDELLRSLVCVS